VAVAPTVTQRAAQYIANQQQNGGLLKSWQEEPADFAWLYDQALGLIVLSESGYLPQANQLATKLHNLQNDDGSWYVGYHYLTSAPITTAKPVGAIAWTVYALTRYYQMGGTPMAYQDALRGAAWLASLQRSEALLHEYQR
jgi:hypothetical protein